MSKQDKRDEFSPKTKEIISKRASFICSNPDCRSLTLYPSDAEPNKFIYIGKVAHITAASQQGARFESSLTPEQRSSSDNGIFLCSNCADMIDKNNGVDFTVALLKKWKNEHEKWVKDNLNQSVTSPVSIIDGEHYTKGKGQVTGIDAQEPVLIKPGTKSVAEGEGNITATRIAYNKGEEK